MTSNVPGSNYSITLSPREKIMRSRVKARKQWICIVSKKQTYVALRQKPSGFRAVHSQVLLNDGDIVGASC